MSYAAVLSELRKILESNYPEEDGEFVVFDSDFYRITIYLNDERADIRIYDMSFDNRTDYFVNFKFYSSTVEVSRWIVKRGERSVWEDILVKKMTPENMLELFKSILFDYLPNLLDSLKENESGAIIESLFQLILSLQNFGG